MFSISPKMNVISMTITIYRYSHVNRHDGNGIIENAHDDDDDINVGSREKNENNKYNNHDNNNNNKEEEQK